MSNLPHTNTRVMGWEETKERNNRLILKARALSDFFIGIIVLAAGIVFVKKDHFGITRLQEIDDDGLLIPLFGGLCILYAVWRFFRGYMKIKNS
jgi:hypothetical protein